MEIGGAGRARVGLSGERDVGKKDEGREEKRPRSEESVDISTIGNDTATLETEAHAGSSVWLRPTLVRVG